MKDLFTADLKTKLLLATALTVGTLTSLPALANTQLTRQQRDLVGLGGALVVTGLWAASRYNPNATLAENPLPPSVSVTSNLSTEPLVKLATDAAKFPHVMVIGKTGAGKSTVTQWLASLCEGKRYVVAPHFDVANADKEWSTCDGVFCVGRNYGGEDDATITYADLISGQVPSPTANQVLRAIYDEMDLRYRSTEGFGECEVHNWIFDESPAVARALGKVFGHNLAPLLYEARKVGIRLWLVTQSDQVEALQIKGMSKIRDNFSYLYLGNAVSERLRKLKKRVPVPPEGHRLAVVDSTVALLPTVEVMYEAMEEAAVGSRFVAQFPDAKPLAPSALAIAKRGKFTEDEVEYYAQHLETLLQVEPTVTKTAVLKLWNFTSRNHGIGSELYTAAKQLLT